MIQPPLRKPRAFALVATLMIIVVLTILVTAFTVAMRTERSASHNFSERERAQAVANGMLHRIFADYAAPVLSTAADGTSNRLAPFAVDSATKLPTASTKATYFADYQAPNTLLNQIYTMSLSPAKVTTTNHLARLSGPASGGGTAAYAPKYWAYARQTAEPTYYPMVNGTPTAPSWVDCFAADGKTKIGQVAYAIWDESGKVDINMAGPDGIDAGGTVDPYRINGLAPHDLKFESLFKDSSVGLAFLDGATGKRDRSDFSLRQIVSSKPGTKPNPNGTANNTGDDRSYFSVEGMLARNTSSSQLIDPARAIDVSTFSRDFEVTPEWNGDRSPPDPVTGEPNFLKSYVNNPEMFGLFSNSNTTYYGSAGLIKAMDPSDVMNEAKWNAALAAYGLPSTPVWKQTMRLLAVLRKSLYPYKPMDCPETSTPLDPVPPDALHPYSWNDKDVYAIAMNILQAAAPADDENLTAYDKATYKAVAVNDAFTRFGVRLSPYVVEVALSAKRTDANNVLATEYIKFWNPYPVSLASIKYVYGGSWGGAHWPGLSISNITGGLFDYNDASGGQPGTEPLKMLTGPRAKAASGYFTVVAQSRTLNLAIGHDLVLKTRPWMYNSNYYQQHTVSQFGPNEESIGFEISGGTFSERDTKAGATTSNMDMWYYIPAADLNVAQKLNWFSYQIDDPRMGLLSRYTPHPPAQNLSTLGTVATTPENRGAQQNTFNDTPMTYSWKAYPGINCLFDSTLGLPIDKTVYQKNAVYGDGFNVNFGENFPASWGTGATAKKRALASFALPGRPFTNLGELSTVYANRPWQTLSVGTDPALARILDYYTTIGTTTVDTNLPYQTPSGYATASGLKTGNVAIRKQDHIWLFESTDASEDTKPTGNLRPIRGRINLNSASRDTLMRLICGQDSKSQSTDALSTYSLVGSLGNGATPITNSFTPDKKGVTVSAAEAGALADEIIKIRPLRSLSDLGLGGPDGKGITATTAFTSLQTKLDTSSNFVGSVADAILGRLAQFGTVRQQTYTVDMIARATKTAPNGNTVTTGEVRMLAHVYFDTFNRKAFIESLEYR